MGAAAGLEIVWVAIGGAVGALLRFELGHRLRLRLDEPVLATLLVNLSGCLVAGAVLAASSRWGEPAQAFLLAGLLGSYTTVSALALEVLILGGARRYLASAAYLLATFAGGIACAASGWFAVAWWTGP